MKEKEIQNKIQENFHLYGRLFKNDNGCAYHKIYNNKYIPFTYGMGIGVSDLIGFTDIVVTQDMVGKSLPVFTALEVKTQTGRPSQEQLNFINLVNTHNGVAGIVRSQEEVEEIIKKWHTK